MTVYKPEWTKWGLFIANQVTSEGGAPEATRCHDLVADWLDTHPEDAAEWRQQQQTYNVGNYFQILELANERHG